MPSDEVCQSSVGTYCLHLESRRVSRGSKEGAASRVLRLVHVSPDNTGATYDLREGCEMAAAVLSDQGLCWRLGMWVLHLCRPVNLYGQVWLDDHTENTADPLM